MKRVSLGAAVVSAPASSSLIVALLLVVPPQAACAAPSSTPVMSKSAASAGRATPVNLSAYERAVVAEMNAVRRDPRAYAGVLVKLRAAYGGKGGRVLRVPGHPVPIITVEGTVAVDEAIAALRRAPRAPALKISAGMSRAARDHVRDVGPKGLTSHTSSDGSSPFERLQRYGRWLHVAAENIHYGAPTAKQVVIQLLIDDGVSSRGHRTNILERKHRVTGVACGKHRRWRTVCVITYAGGFVDRR